MIFSLKSYHAVDGRCWKFRAYIVDKCDYVRWG
jgi:hypothetical protein